LVIIGMVLAWALSLLLRQMLRKSRQYNTCRIS